MDLTKAHIPPKCAGNRSPTVRTRPFVDRTRQWESPRDGGLWLRTICQPCNNLASKYDDSYGAFADSLRPHVDQHPLTLITVNGVPPIAVAPGRVARSVLHGMVALAPSFHLVHGQFLRDLLRDGDDIRLPEGMRLRVARTGDDHTRISSAYHLHRVLTQRQDYEAFAEIYFRPLVWLLTGGPSAFGPSLPDQEGWGDATDWIMYSRDCWRSDLRDVLKALPTTVHPSRRGRSSEEWIEFESEVSYLLEGVIG
jgi:hypothetical protein